MDATDFVGGEDERFVNLWLMIRLHQISKRHKTFEAFLQSSGVSKGTMWKLMRGEGNPTFELVNRIAESQGMSFLELLGLDQTVIKKELSKHGIDFDHLMECSKDMKSGRSALMALLATSAR